MDLSQNEWAAMRQSKEETILLDVRTIEEYNQGHIPNAQLIDIQNPQYFLHKLELLNPSKTYLVYCRSGARSSQACVLMKNKGIENCFNLLGGINQWNGEIVT